MESSEREKNSKDVITKSKTNKTQQQPKKLLLNTMTGSGDSWRVCLTDPHILSMNSADEISAVYKMMKKGAVTTDPQMF